MEGTFLKTALRDASNKVEAAFNELDLWNNGKIPDELRDDIERCTKAVDLFGTVVLKLYAEYNRLASLVVQEGREEVIK